LAALLEAIGIGLVLGGFDFYGLSFGVDAVVSGIVLLSAGVVVGGQISAVVDRRERAQNRDK